LCGPWCERGADFLLTMPGGHVATVCNIDEVRDESSHDAGE